MGIRVLLCCFLLQNTDYANRINSRSMSRVFCDLRSQKTPRGILPVNSNKNSTSKVIKIIFACVNIHFLV